MRWFSASMVNTARTYVLNDRGNVVLQNLSCAASVAAMGTYPSHPNRNGNGPARAAAECDSRPVRVSYDNRTGEPAQARGPGHERAAADPRAGLRHRGGGAGRRRRRTRTVGAVGR